MCQDIDQPGVIVIGMENAQVARAKIGGNFVEVMQTYLLRVPLQTVYSIKKTSRGDFVLGTNSGIHFIRWNI